MIVRKLSECRSSERSVTGPDIAGQPGWESTRMLLEEDGMGFSFHITRIFTGAELHLHYLHHLESVYCISGKGSIEDLQTGQRHSIEPGVMYALDRHDKHILRADIEMEMACCFNPPVTGREVHDDKGSYPAAE